MIIDHIRNYELYEGLSPMIQIALRYIANTNFANLPEGKYEIDSDRVFAIVQDYKTQSAKDKMWEAHKGYVDVQFVVRGKEQIGWTDIKKAHILSDYNKEKDIYYFKAQGSFIIADEGTFVIFAPHDVHMPGIMIHQPEDVKKVVVKVKINY